MWPFKTFEQRVNNYAFAVKSGRISMHLVPPKFTVAVGELLHKVEETDPKDHMYKKDLEPVLDKLIDLIEADKFKYDIRSDTIMIPTVRKNTWIQISKRVPSSSSDYIKQHLTDYMFKIGSKTPNGSLIPSSQTRIEHNDTLFKKINFIYKSVLKLEENKRAFKFLDEMINEMDILERDLKNIRL